MKTKGPYQPKTGARCSCKRGIQRDNCSNCEGTGWVIDFRAIRGSATSKEGGNVFGTQTERCANYMNHLNKAILAPAKEGVKL